MDVERADHTELRDLYTRIDEVQQLLRDALFFLPEEEDHFWRELVVVERHRVGGLLEPRDDPALLLLPQQIRWQVCFGDLFRV